MSRLRYALLYKECSDSRTENPLPQWFCCLCLQQSPKYDLPEIPEVREINNSKGLKICHLNISSLHKHIDNLKALLFRCNFHIVTLSETHLNDGVDNSLIVISGYTLCRKHRSGVRGIGGDLCS